MRPFLYFLFIFLVAGDPQTILFEHNRIRCEVAVPAARMPAMKWDPKLAQVGQEYLDSCPGFTHNDNRSKRYAQLGGSGYVGENLYWTSAKGTFFREAILAFEKEKPNFDAKLSCAQSDAICGCKNMGNCGHYSQIIWDDSILVGCASNNACPSGGTTVICNYAPGGNYVGEYPYTSSPTPLVTEACAGAGPIEITLTPDQITLSTNGNDAKRLIDDNIKTRWFPSPNEAKPVMKITFPSVDIDTMEIYTSKLEWAPKRVDFVHNGEKMKYKIAMLPDGKNFKVSLNLGFKQVNRLKMIFRKRTEEMKIGEIKFFGKPALKLTRSLDYKLGEVVTHM